MKEHKVEKRFTDLNAAMQQYFLVTGRQLEPLPPESVFSDFYREHTTKNFQKHLTMSLKFTSTEEACLSSRNCLPWCSSLPGRWH